LIVFFLDANVLFSTVYKPQSAPGLLIDFAAAGLARAVTSAYALEEARRNLALKAPDAIPAWERVRSSCALCPSPSNETLEWSAAQIVAKDAPILAASIDAGCDWLVTGDRRDFGHLFGSNQRGVLVISPSEALRRLIDQLQIEG
jgi:predicted nucleic acid-binding protein